jgi:hypothetical protein
VFAALALLVAWSAAAGAVAPGDGLLGRLAPAPWLDTPDTSQQYFPIFIGASPRELVLGRPPARRPRLQAALRPLGQTQAPRILQTLGAPSAELEAWPSEDWNGQPNWVYARWRESPGRPWRWLSASANWRAEWTQRRGEKPLLPEERDPGSPADKLELFGDFLDYSQVNQMPLFGNCVYTERAGGAVALAWPHPREKDARAAELSKPGRYAAHCLNPPARFNAEPVAFALRVGPGGVEWPAEIEWLPAPAPRPAPVDVPLRVRAWPKEHARRFEEDLRVVDGEEFAIYPLSARRARFLRKGSFQRDNDLEKLADYLEERYRVLGIGTRRQRFDWRGIPQSNLIAVIPGREEGPPVILADHIDAACAHDVFERTRERVTVAGADDNATATATLLRAAAVLKGLRLRRPVWLVHLTGEEMPSDGIGAWRLINEELAGGRDVRAVVIADFIGWHRPGKRAFQVSPTAAPGSERMAALALDAARKLAPGLTALYAPRDKERNAVFNTDLQEFEYVGIPGVLFNEDMDYSEPGNRSPHNHRSSDVAANADIPFAADVARVAIETAARIADDPDVGERRTSY